jgi:hypothetical protein
MKTGRVRRKGEPPPEAEGAAPTPPPEGQAPEEAAASVVEPGPEPSSGWVAEPAAGTLPELRPEIGAQPRPQAEIPQVSGSLPQAGPSRSSLPPGCILGLIVGVIALVVLFAVMQGRAARIEWVPVTQATGAWTATVNLFGPQVTSEQRWESDCTADPRGAIRAGSCILKDSGTYRDNVIDDYEEYAYDIYYEETWSQVYQAQGTEFVVTALESDDWWEGNRHFTRQEELDRDSCTYTSYTVWVDDPGDQSHEIEVYLAECEVWDHVLVSERVAEQQLWCLCDLTTLVTLGTQTGQGEGSRVLWPSASVPEGGRAEQAFQGQVTFLGGDYTYSLTTGDPAQYERYLTQPCYLGIRNGRAVEVSASRPR